jgi:hypothetical protein
MLNLQGWLADYWVVGAGFMAASLIAVAPVVPLSLPAFLIFLHSPVYMIHQVEEHTGDRFRKFVNENVFGGRDTPTVASVLVINLPFVWGIKPGGPLRGIPMGSHLGAWSPLMSCS